MAADRAASMLGRVHYAPKAELGGRSAFRLWLPCLPCPAPASRSSAHHPATRAAITLELGPDASKATQRPIIIDREPHTLSSWSPGSALAHTQRSCLTAPSWFSGLSNIRQCGDDVLRMLVTGGPPVRGGGGMPQRIRVISVPVSVLRITGPGRRRTSARDCRHSG
jgi:hypothetical protein